MRRLFFVLIFLVLGAHSGYAQCTGGTNGTVQTWAYLLQHEFQAGQVAGIGSPCFRDFVATTQASIVWNVIFPTNTSADVTTIQNAVNGSKPVLMAPGNWQVCSQITMPANQRLEGFYVLSNPGSLAPSTSYSKTILSCPNNGSFSSGQAFIAMKDHDEVRGLDIYCNFGSSPTFNNINALNAVSVEIDHNNLYYCKEGVDRFSDGNVPGFSANYSQLAHIHDDYFEGQTDHGIRADGVNGGFTTDEMYGPGNDFAIIQNAAAIYMNGGGGSQFIGNRLEWGDIGIELENDFVVAITGTLCDNVQGMCMKIGSSQIISVVGTVNHLGPGVEFLGANSNIQFSGNSWSFAPMYTVDSGGTFTATVFNEQPAAAADTSSLFANDFTQSVIQPLMGITNAALSSALPPIEVLSPTVGNHMQTRGFTPTVSTCGTSPSIVGDDSSGAITTGTGSPTACTLTFAAPYTYAPYCTANTSSTSSNASFSSLPSTTAFTVNLSSALTSGKIQYQCIEQSPNLVSGTPGMVGGAYSAFNATVTTAAATDPAGGSNAVRITEDSTTANRHIDQGSITTGSTGQNTASVYVHTGSSGSRNVTFGVYDTSFTNELGAIFSPTDGSFVSIGQNVGSGAIVSTGSQSVGNGWYRCWFTFTLNGNAPTSGFVGLASSTNYSYNGDGASNLLVWGPAVRPGSLP